MSSRLIKLQNNESFYKTSMYYISGLRSLENLIFLNGIKEIQEKYQN